jgi:transaldolase
VNQGAHTQRLLWASTSTKDDRFSDLLYVEALMGPDTVDTMPPAPLRALRDHGEADNRLEDGIEEAREVMAALARAGVSMDDITGQLLDAGVRAFSSSFDKLLGSLDKKRAHVAGAA